jgi:ketosteroid isomerase-like protein
MSADLIRRFYESFDAHDGEAMAACYAPDARFEDPAFGELRGAEVGSMWRMLTGRAADLRVELHEHQAEGDRGSAHWIARYTFSTGRPVVNDIEASFRFEDGLIAEHVDRFDFGRWARQALGPMGIAMTVAPPLRAVVRRKARADLAEFMGSRA